MTKPELAKLKVAQMLAADVADMHPDEIASGHASAAAERLERLLMIIDPDAEADEEEAGDTPGDKEPPAKK